MMFGIWRKVQGGVSIGVVSKGRLERARVTKKKNLCEGGGVVVVVVVRRAPRRPLRL